MPPLCTDAGGGAGWYVMRDAVVAATNDMESSGDVGSFNRVVGLYPDVSFAYYLRGTRHLANGNALNPSEQPAQEWARAESDFNRTIELDPQSPAAYLARVGTRTFLGTISQQDFDDVDRVIAWRPEHPVAYGLRGTVELAASKRVPRHT